MEQRKCFRPFLRHFNPTVLDLTFSSTRPCPETRRENGRRTSDLTDSQVIKPRNDPTFSVNKDMNFDFVSHSPFWIVSYFNHKTVCRYPSDDQIHPNYSRRKVGLDTKVYQSCINGILILVTVSSRPSYTFLSNIQICNTYPFSKSPSKNVYLIVFIKCT